MKQERPNPGRRLALSNVCGKAYLSMVRVLLLLGFAFICLFTSLNCLHGCSSLLKLLLTLIQQLLPTHIKANVYRDCISKCCDTSACWAISALTVYASFRWQTCLIALLLPFLACKQCCKVSKTSEQADLKVVGRFLPSLDSGSKLGNLAFS